MPGTVVSWREDEWVEVEIDNRPPRANRVKVPCIDYVSCNMVEGQWVTVPMFGIKPWHERVVDLTQGIEKDTPVHVDAKKIYGNGKFYVAITRAKQLSNLKTSNVEPTFQGLRSKLRSNWRALLWLASMGEPVPAYQLKWASDKKKMYDQVFGASSSTL